MQISKIYMCWRLVCLLTTISNDVLSSLFDGQFGNIHFRIMLDGTMSVEQVWLVTKQTRLIYIGMY